MNLAQLFVTEQFGILFNMTLTFRSTLTGFFGGCRSATIAGGLTRYIQVTGGTPNATEDNMTSVVSDDGKIRWMYLRTSTAQSATGTLTITLRVNGADSSLALTLGAGAAAGLYSQTGITVSVVAGDRITLKIVEGSGTSAAITGIGLLYHGKDPLWSHSRTMVSSTGTGATLAASSTGYVDFTSGAIQATETARQNISPSICLIRNLFFTTTTTQPASGSLVVTMRKNEVDTSLTITIAANSVAGTYSDTVNTTKKFNPGDRVNLKLVNNATATSAGTSGKAFYTYDPKRRQRTTLIIGTNADTVTASSTEYTGGADGGVFQAAENGRYALSAGSGKLRNFYLYSSTAQPASGSVVFTYRVNTVDTSLVITVPANSAAGVYSDTTNSATIAAGDILTIKAVNNATAASCTTRFAILQTE